MMYECVGDIPDVLQYIYAEEMDGCWFFLSVFT